MRSSPYHGLLVLDKPRGLTSRDAVDRAQRWFPRDTRIGHTGTLDPLATGVLVLCIGSATRLTEYVQDMPKTYHAGILLGIRSDTDDADGHLTPAHVAAAPDRETVQARLGEFLGEQQQVPPAYSAAKVTGRRAYDLARRGEEVPLQPRTVHIYSIDLLFYAWPQLQIIVRCGKGTYIRSLARDLGERLGCGGLIETLRRTQVGPFTVEEAVPLEATAPVALTRLQPLAAAVAGLPRMAVSAVQADRLRKGQRIPLLHAGSADTVPAGGAEVAVFAPGDVFVGVARLGASQSILAPVKILPTEQSAS